MEKKRRITRSIKPFKFVILGLASLLSVTAALLALPFTFKVIFVSLFGAVFFVTLGVVIQSLQSPGYGITSWHFRREPEYVRSFIRDALEAVTKKGDRIEVDCMGIKSGTASDVLESTINSYNWESAKCRYLILESGSEGALNREIIEGRRRLDLSTKRGLEAAALFGEKLRKRFSTANVLIKTYHFLPAFYIIRINDHMLVSFYLKDKGTYCPYLILRHGPDSFFLPFKKYFDSMFDSELSNAFDTKSNTLFETN